MKILFRIPAENIVETYNKIRQVLTRNDNIIFEAMKNITARKRSPFQLPTNPGEFEEKHQEITKILRSSYLGGKETALQLMEEVYSIVTASSGVPGVSNDEILKHMAFRTNQNVIIRLNGGIRWAAEWNISHAVEASEKTSVLLDIHDKSWGECVPSYVLHYISSAIFAYEQNMNPAAVALLSIATEATLRDVLETKGYSFIAGGSSVESYSYTPATLGIDGDKYTVSFQCAMPKLHSDFLVSTGGTPTVDIKIRRVKNHRNPRIDLHIIAPIEVVDHLACNIVDRPAVKKVNGLGEALDIARNTERILLPKDLPLDFDEVIKKVRNNLIHLSANTLSAEIPMINDPDTHRPITLGKFLENPDMVYDLMCSIPQFINAQYVALRNAGFLI